MTRILVEAIEHPGFAFVHVLSPCPTFRPDEKSWKDRVHPFADNLTEHRVEAAQRIAADDGLGIGSVYAERLPCWQSGSELVAHVEDFEAEFRV